MQNFSNRSKAILIICLTITISIFHYLTPVQHQNLHAIYQRLYYLPIILGAIYFELWPGILFTLIIILLYIPHLAIQWNGFRPEVFSKSMEMGMMIIIATVVGFTTKRKRVEFEKKEEIQKQLSKLDRFALLGKLSAGLAHEIRNPLGSLIN